MITVTLFTGRGVVLCLDVFKKIITEMICAMQRQIVDRGSRPRIQVIQHMCTDGRLVIKYIFLYYLN